MMGHKGGFPVLRRAATAAALALGLFFAVPAAPALAACSSPAGTEGQIVYNADQNVPQVCVGSAWIALGVLNPAAGGSGCNSPTGTEGQILYNEDAHMPQYCDGDDWQAMIGGGGINLGPSIGVVGWGGTGDGGQESFIHARGYAYNWTDTSAGWGASCGIDTSGKLWCWGPGTDGQVASGSTSTLWQPTQVGANTDWTKVTAGGLSACGLRGGRAFCWGRNTTGQSGNGNTTTPQLSPVEVAGGAYTDWTHISMGFANGGVHACGLRGTGRAFCWGANTGGQTGNGNTTSPQLTPVEVAGAFTDWTDIAAGVAATCGIRNSGRLYCWGSNSNGETAQGTTSGNTLAVTQVGTDADWTQIDGGSSFFCGIKAGGEAYCWGYNLYGSIGDNSSGNTRTTIRRVGTAGTSTLWSDWIAIDAGGYITCGIRADGAGYCWGLITPGASGGSNVSETHVPTPIGGIGDLTSVEAGQNHALFTRAQ